MDFNDGHVREDTNTVCGEVVDSNGKRETAHWDTPGTDCAAALAALQKYLDGMPYADHGNAQIVQFGDVSCAAPTYVQSRSQNMVYGCSGPFGGIRVPVQ